LFILSPLKIQLEFRLLGIFYLAK